MAASNGKGTIYGDNFSPIMRPSKSKVWFLNGDLVKIIHRSTAEDIVTLYNMNTGVTHTTSFMAFKKKRRRAFTIMETAKLLNYHRKSIPRLIKGGYLPEARGEKIGGKREFHYLSYYSEDDILEARRLLSQTHHGQPRKDGLVTNNKVPSEQELKAAMGDGIMLYTRLPDGTFMPIFDETM